MGQHAGISPLTFAQSLSGNFINAIKKIIASMLLRNLLSFSLLLLSLPIIQSVAIAKGDSNTGEARRVKTGPCVVGRTAPPVGFWTWPRGTQVKVYLREPEFSGADISAVKLALASWDASATENGSNVRFSFHGLTREIRHARREITIVRGSIYNEKQRHRAHLEAHSINGDRFIDYALIIVDHSVQDAGLLTNVIAHEIGHTLGLLDCPRCSNRSSAMGLLKPGNESNGIEGPTACDTGEVMGVYRALKPRLLIAARE